MNAPAPTTVAGCRLGSVRFAVALQDVQQLLPRPAQLTAVPRREGALVGAVALRDAVVPVVDLRRWLPWPPGDAPDAPGLLLVLRQGAQRLAVSVDAVEGLRRVGPAGVQALAHGETGGEAEPEVFHSVVQSTGADEPVALLDVAALLRLGQVWAGSAGEAGGPEAAVPSDRSNLSAPVAQTAHGTQPYALLDSEGQCLAVPAALLRAVLPMPPLQTLWAADPCRLGVAHWRGRDVPVLRLLPQLGVCPAAEQAPPLLAVVEHGGCCLGLALHAVHDVRRLDPSAAQGVAALGLPPCPALAGVLTLDGRAEGNANGGRVLLLDVAGWVASEPMAALGVRRDSSHTGKGPGLQAQSTADAHVVVRAGTPWALPLSQVLAIADVPPGWTPGEAPWPHTWRQQALPLWDLRALLGRGPCQGEGQARLLVVQTPAMAQPVGLVVEELLHLVPARTAQQHRLRQAGGRSVPFLVRGSGAAQQSFAVLADADWAHALPA